MSKRDLNRGDDGVCNGSAIHRSLAVNRASDTPARGTTAPAYATIVRLASSRAALWVGAAWGFAEATFFFIVPDVWLGFVALYAPRRVPRTLVAIVAGAAVGVTVLYVAIVVAADALTTAVLAMPDIGHADLEQARARLTEDGASAIVTAPLEGRPLKLYALAAALDGLGLVELVLAAVLNRLARLVVVGAVLAAIGWAARSIIARRPRLVAVVYALSWTAFYAVYLATHQG